MNFPRHLRDHRRFITLSQQRCDQLLRTRNVGHVGLSLPDGPSILPVTYLVHNHGIVFRAELQGTLARLARPQLAVFEVDDLDHETQTGWSVQVRGLSKAINEPAELITRWPADPLSQQIPGGATLFIHVESRQTTGRQITAQTVGAESAEG